MGLVKGKMPKNKKFVKSPVSFRALRKNYKQKNQKIERSFGNHSLLILELEMQKCILLCANCHRERHYPHLNMNNFFSD